MEFKALVAEHGEPLWEDSGYFLFSNGKCYAGERRGGIMTECDIPRSCYKWIIEDLCKSIKSFQLQQNGTAQSCKD